MRQIDSSRIEYKDGVKDAKMIYLDKLRSDEVYHFIDFLASSSGHLYSMATKFNFSSGEIEEVHSRCLEKALKKLSETEITRDETYTPAKNSKEIENGKMVVLGDLYRYYSTVLKNACVDQTRRNQADRRGGDWMGVSLTSEVETCGHENLETPSYMNAIEDSFDSQILRKQAFYQVESKTRSKKLKNIAERILIQQKAREDILEEIEMSTASYLGYVRTIHSIIQ